MKKKCIVCLLTVLLFSIFLTGCDAGKDKGESYLNATVLEVQENILIVKPIDNQETKAPKEVKEAEKLTLDLTRFDIKVMPENLTVGEKIRVVFNEDSVERDNNVKIKIVFAVYRIDKNGDIIIEE